MDIVTYIAFLGEQRSARMQTDANLDRPGRKRLRHGPRCRKSSGGSRKGEEEGVTLGIHFVAPLGCALFPDHAAMLGKRRSVFLRPQLVEKLRRAFDVREEEGDSPGWQLHPHTGK